MIDKDPYLYHNILDKLLSKIWLWISLCYNVRMSKVEIYTTPTCVYCKAAKEYFHKNNVQYAEYDVMSDLAKRQEMINLTHQYGVPVIVIDGKIVLGFDRRRINELLGLS